MLKLALPERFILKWMFIGCLLAVPVYFINLFSFPNVIFGEEFNLDTSRGMLRVPVFFLEIMAFFCSMVSISYCLTAGARIYG